MGNLKEPIHLPLTQEQQEIIRRFSGQFARVIEITPSSSDFTEGQGRTLEFHWRLSSSTGIPRQMWAGSDEANENKGDAPPAGSASPSR